MASVYLARDQALGREVALKVLSPIVAENQQFLLRFRREARVVAGLKHPHIVPLEDFGEIEGYAYLAMPLYPSSLADRMALGAVSLAEAPGLVSQVASALAYAHKQGVVHRDVKPSNILLDHDRNAMLSDFGLAQIQDASVSLTGSAMVGTPAYVSPEQVRGDPVDGRADQYALGIVLFQITTGRLPFVAETPIAVLLKHANEPIPGPSDLNPSIPAAIDQVILTATSKDPDDRFATVSDLAEAFREAVESTAGELDRSTRNFAFARPKARRGTPPRPRNRFRGRRWVLPVGIGAGVAALLLVGVIVGGGFGQSVGDEPSEARLTALQETISSLSTGIAASGGTLSPEEVATIVAATLTAPPPATPVEGTRTPSATPTPVAPRPTEKPSATPNPTRPAPTAAPSPTPLVPLPTLPLGIGFLRRSRGTLSRR